MPLNLDNLRSTRKRVAKPIPASTTRRVSRRLPQAANDTNHVTPTTSPLTPEVIQRDFSRNLGNQHPLRAIFLGHNPSTESWRLSAPYAHPSNRFWPLLQAADLAPPSLCRAQLFAQLPHAVGLGFTDLYVTSGSDAAKVFGKEGDSLRQDVQGRILAGTDGVPPRILCCVSKVVAKKLLGTNVDIGKLGVAKDHGLNQLDQCEIWVLPSTSGRAGLTWEQRLTPFKHLKQAIDTMPWPPEKPSEKSASQDDAN